MNPIDDNFLFKKNQLTKSGKKGQGGGKCPSSCQLGLRGLSTPLVFREMEFVSLGGVT